MEELKSTLATWRGLMSLSQAAKFLPICEMTVRRWAAAGKLPTRQVGGRRYVDPQDLARLLSADDK